MSTTPPLPSTREDLGTRLVLVTLLNLLIIGIVVVTLLASWPAPSPTSPAALAPTPSQPAVTPTAPPTPEAPVATTPPPTTSPDGSWPPATGEPPQVEVTEGDKLLVRYVPRLEADNPYAAQWRQAPWVPVSLLPQQMAMPMLKQGSLDEVRVQGLYDARSISWRVSWKDPTADGNVDTGRFSDGVAIGFPLDPGAPATMGADKLRVQILYWKALWQKDVDVGFQDVQSLHPNYWADLYWFAEGQFPYPVPAAFQQPAARQWFIAHQAGNPMAAFSRTQPVEELVAEGWSTLTHQPQAVTTGRGAWAKGTWAVVFTRPLKTTDPLDYTFVPGAPGQIVFAAWQGSAGNRGGRKQWSNWVDFSLEPSNP